MVKSVSSVGKSKTREAEGCEKMNSESESARTMPGILGGRAGHEVYTSEEKQERGLERGLEREGHTAQETRKETPSFVDTATCCGGPGTSATTIPPFPLAPLSSKDCGKPPWEQERRASLPQPEGC